MKIIFLDIDGVLNSAEFMERRQQEDTGVIIPDFKRWLEMLDENAIQLLNQIVEAADAKIVISSTWRIINNKDAIAQMLKIKGFKGDVIDVTPRFPGDIRGNEILDWLSRNKVDDFIILDDDGDMGELMSKLIRTSWQFGLQEKHVKEAVEKLGEKQ